MIWAFLFGYFFGAAFLKLVKWSIILGLFVWALVGHPPLAVYLLLTLIVARRALR